MNVKTPPYISPEKERELKRLEERILEATNTTREEVMSRRRYARIIAARMGFIDIMRYDRGMTLKNIAKKWGFAPHSVIHSLKVMDDARDKGEHYTRGRFNATCLKKVVKVIDERYDG